MTTTAPLSPYDLVGADRVAALVQSFYDLIESEPAYARLRAIHGPDLTAVRAGFERFLTGWLGGPRDWFDAGRCVMSLHTPMRIGPVLADEWAGAMTAAVKAQQWDDPRLSDQVQEALARIARAMIGKS